MTKCRNRPCKDGKKDIAQELDSSINNESRKCLDCLQENRLPSHRQQITIDTLMCAISALGRAGRYLVRCHSGEVDGYSLLDDVYREQFTEFIAYLQGDRALPMISSLRKKHRLSGEEMEILLLLASSAIGTIDAINNVHDLQGVFPPFRRSRMKTAQMLLPNSRLIKSGLVQLAEARSFKDSFIAAEPCFVEAILCEQEQFSFAWNCSNQEELLKKLPLLRRMINAAVEEMDNESNSGFSYVRREKRTLDHYVELFLKETKSKWKLAGLFNKRMDREEAVILIALLGDAIHPDSRKPTFWSSNTAGFECNGENLAKAAAKDPDEVNEVVRKHLTVSSRLVNKRLIAPIATEVRGLQEDTLSVAKKYTFQLTDSCLKRIGVKRDRDNDNGRIPLLRMEQLELSPAVRQSLELAINQYACRDVLESWELEKTIPYGRAMTMLFYGPSGVGKTASAEAVAATLNKRILVADYSQIQSCWVGETEKSIVKLFNKAREGDCVLFWDEADAMFYDRETASSNWEVREVNVLLQELEKFNGICILSTNRNVELDKALARRISLKIEFKPPTREQALAIWKKLLPKKMPLAEDLDFATLCSADLTGGEIKNVILNAARRAVARGRAAKLKMEDFKWALTTELEGRGFQGGGGRKLGF